MAKYLIDANLPYRFSSWYGSDYIHVFDLNDRWSDWEIWDYASMA
jgi:predicted nuclease of predicted toxin-antitoxin system